MKDRIVRISEEVKKELSNVIQNELKDPRLPAMVSVVKAEVTRDLKHAKVFVSILASESEQKGGMEALESAAGFLRRELSRRLNLRNTPQLKFVLDDSIEKSLYITKLIDETRKKDTAVLQENDIDSELP